MNQQSFDRTTAMIFLGLVAFLAISFTAKPVANLLESLVKMSAASNAETAEARPHESADLAAQRSMAFAAWLMLGAAAVIAVIGIWYVRETLLSNRELNNQQLRPWLSVELKRVMKDEENSTRSNRVYSVELTISNDGGSPATNLDVHADILVSDGGEGADPRTLFDRICDERLGTFDGGGAGKVIITRPITEYPRVSYSRVETGERMSKLTGSFFLTLIVCVTYRSPHFVGARQTCASFNLHLEVAGQPTDFALDMDDSDIRFKILEMSRLT